MSSLDGFYYDLQKENELMKVSLHPNMIADPYTHGKFDKCDSTMADSEGYSTLPICESIMHEDFSVAIANSWSECGGDPLGSLWNTLKPLAPYSDFMNDAVDLLSEKQQEYKSRVGERSGKIAKGLTWLVDKLKNGKDKYGEDVTKYLNSSLVVQGSRFSLYSGTGVSFSNMVMKFTLLTEKGSTVSDKLKKILPYAMGHFRDVTPEEITDSKLGQDLKNFIGFEEPPGGYRANIKSLDSSNLSKGIEGTLKLKFGLYYSIRNLVISDVQLSFSKQIAKVPIGNTNNLGNTRFQLQPLYCDVQITLKPAIKFTDAMIDQFVFNNREDEVKAFINNMQQRLSNLENNSYINNLNNV